MLTIGLTLIISGWCVRSDTIDPAARRIGNRMVAAGICCICVDIALAITVLSIGWASLHHWIVR